jgi:hypothetical protein
MVASDKDMVLCRGMGLAASDIDGMWSLVQSLARPPLGEGKVEAAVTQGVLGFWEAMEAARSAKESAFWDFVGVCLVVFIFVQE